MTDPAQKEPPVWQEPGRRERRLGLWIAIAIVALAIGFPIFIIILTLATYG